MLTPKQKFDFKPQVEPRRKGRNKVDLTGYTRMETRVTQLLLAGQKLNRARTELFDTTDPNADPINIRPNPLRRLDFDLADGSELSRRLGNRLADIEHRTRQQTKEVEQIYKGENTSKDQTTVDSKQTEALKK